MFKNTTIKAYQVGLVFEENKLTKVLEEGKYYTKRKEKVFTFNTMLPFSPKVDIMVLLKNEELKKLLNVIEVGDNEIVFSYVNNLFDAILTKGIYAFWKEPINYKFNKYNMEDLKVPDTIPNSLLKRASVIKNIRAYEVSSYEKALLFVNDELKEELNPGTYFYWNNAIKIEVAKIDMRQQSIELLGQEILTKDKANLRINFDVAYKVNNINKALVDNKDYKKQLYTLLQMKLREYVGGFSLDEILENKESVGNYILSKALEESHKLGVSIISAGIRDIILPGDMKEIMNQVLIAQKKAQSNMITRREETAATRSLLNTAKLMEDNEMLFKLKEMEYVEKIADKIGEITVSGNGGMVSQLKEIFSVKD
jgi:regulator of protease activity HflC (stomatin/prohibitin superfamily)